MEDKNLLLVVAAVVALFVFSGGFSKSGAFSITERHSGYSGYNVEPGLGSQSDSVMGSVYYTGNLRDEATSYCDECVLAHGNCIAVQGSRSPICSRLFDHCSANCI